ncbi:interferon-induced GTP-binding protein Mx1-like isoform X1 [Ranitomeya variabilis]|uniref:interferon-induced GTP-binding protein Mx1-like isoform X1 n=2 Tax=Ranitomeya variabilis TaxID=490064 RepID=UPI004056EBDC
MDWLTSLLSQGKKPPATNNHPEGDSIHVKSSTIRTKSKPHSSVHHSSRSSQKARKKRSSRRQRSTSSSATQSRAEETDHACWNATAIEPNACSQYQYSASPSDDQNQHQLEPGELPEERHHNYCDNKPHSYSPGDLEPGELPEERSRRYSHNRPHSKGTDNLEPDDCLEKRSHRYYNKRSHSYGPGDQDPRECVEERSRRYYNKSPHSHGPGDQGPRESPEERSRRYYNNRSHSHGPGDQGHRESPEERSRRYYNNRSHSHGPGDQGPRECPEERSHRYYNNRSHSYGADDHGSRESPEERSHRYYNRPNPYDAHNQGSRESPEEKSHRYYNKRPHPYGTGDPGSRESLEERSRMICKKRPHPYDDNSIGRPGTNYRSPTPQRPHTQDRSLHHSSTKPPFCYFGRLSADRPMPAPTSPDLASSSSCTEPKSTPPRSPHHRHQYRSPTHGQKTKSPHQRRQNRSPHGHSRTRSKSPQFWVSGAEYYVRAPMAFSPSTVESASQHCGSGTTGAYSASGSPSELLMDDIMQTNENGSVFTVSSPSSFGSLPATQPVASSLFMQLKPEVPVSSFSFSSTTPAPQPTNGLTFSLENISPAASPCQKESPPAPVAIKPMEDLPAAAEISLQDPISNRGSSAEVLVSEGVTAQPDNVLSQQYEHKIRPCIDLIDSLRSLGVEKDLGLPAIAVIGDQSSGKSSVLEALSGVNLPRGSGIVTRCPLVLKLKKSKNGSPWKGKISYLAQNVELKTPGEVEQEIRKAQNHIAGPGKGVSQDLITLEVVSPNVPDLTLLDLPGITRVAVADQPQDIGQQIKKMIKKYIEKQETINLAVVPSNVDIATTEALKMAQEVDPSGERTLGILTKPDLVDKGMEPDVVSVVQNLVYKLKKGYMIVKCRGQSEIMKNISLETALQNEQAFFEDNEHFRVLLKERRATTSLLAEKLTVELVEHISRTIPNLENQIKAKLQKAEMKVEMIGAGVPESESEKLSFLIERIKRFVDEITQFSQGEEEVAEGKQKLFTTIRKLFSKWEAKLKESADDFPRELKDDVNSFENQHRGRELTGFINFKTFENIAKNQIKTYEEPAINKLKEVTECVRSAFHATAVRHFAHYYNLYRSAKEKLENICSDQQREAEKMIHTQFKVEKNIYCQDSIYGGALRNIRAEAAKEAAKEAVLTTSVSPFGFSGKSQQKKKSAFSVEEMSQHIEAYFKNTTARLSNQIPLIILHYMLHEFADKLQSQMWSLIQDKENLSVLLMEKEDVARERKELKDQIQRLRAAQRRLARFPC